MSRTVRVLRLAALAVLALPATALAQSEPQAVDRPLKVMSYNVQFGFPGQGTPVTDIHRAAAVIRAEDPDVVGIQEILRGCGGRYAFTDQVAQLAEATGMHVSFGPWETDDSQGEGLPRCQNGGAVLSKRPFRSETYRILPWTQIYQRGMNDVSIKFRGVNVRIYNTHLQNSQGGSPAAAKDRADQVNAILAHAGALEEPTILLGDFNAEPTAPELAPIFETFQDAWAIGGDGTPGYTLDAVNPTRRIDYVLTSPDIGVERARVLPTLASDHRPVVADLLLPGAAVGGGSGR
jgi:endonuclease/exonuclease/phosphatase family metal-dependent hydrolase